MALEGWELIYTGIGIVVSTVGITKLMLNSMLKSIKHHCAMQKDACTAWRLMSDQDRKKLWKHGHKGLDENGSKVTV